MNRDLTLYAREKLKSFVTTIDKKLLEIRFERIPQIIDHPIFIKSSKINLLGKQILDHIMEHNSRPAKRLRASFIYYGYKLLKGNNLSEDLEQKLLVAASSIEFTHTGLLIHDDYQDRDSIRR
jgi:geranylgeranyl pyrophosphate synthase